MSSHPLGYSQIPPTARMGLKLAARTSFGSPLWPVGTQLLEPQYQQAVPSSTLSTSTFPRTFSSIFPKTFQSILTCIHFGNQNLSSRHEHLYILHRQLSVTLHVRLAASRNECSLAVVSFHLLDSGSTSIVQYLSPLTKAQIHDYQPNSLEAMSCCPPRCQVHVQAIEHIF